MNSDGDAMRIISIVNLKGGCGKSTTAQCLAYSKAFGKAYKRIALVELDAQGTLAAWSAQRDEGGAVTFTMLDSNSPANVGAVLKTLNKSHNCLILDTPGESKAGFIGKVAIPISDMVIVPMRSSTGDEQSFESNLLPMLKGYLDKVFILPSFTHPNANAARTREYFDALMPDGIRTLKSCLPSRGIFENYDREGRTLDEYARSVKGNARDYKQAQTAIKDVERIAGEIVKHGKA